MLRNLILMLCGTAILMVAQAQPATWWSKAVGLCGWGIGAIGTTLMLAKVVSLIQASRERASAGH